MKIAIVFQSPYGQTQKIAQQIKQNLVFDSQFKDHVHLIDIDQPSSIDLASMDLFIIGFPVYYGKFSKKLIQWVSHQSPCLKNRRLAFFTVSLNAADTRPEARETDDELLEMLVKQTGLVPQFIAPIAGALHFTKYGFIKRFMLKRISRSVGGPTDTSTDHELTDWNEVYDFSQAILKNDESSLFTFTHQCSPTKVRPLRLIKNL